MGGGRASGSDREHSRHCAFIFGVSGAGGECARVAITIVGMLPGTCFYFPSSLRLVDFKRLKYS